MFYQFYLLLQQPRIRARALKHWALWILTTALGWALAGFAGLPIGRVVFAETGLRGMLSVLTPLSLFGLLIGAMIGTSQWMYLRWRIRRAIWWLPATAVGWGLGLPLASLVTILTGLDVLSAVMYGVIIGASVGLAQWILLNRWVFTAGRWLVISIVALPLGITLTGFVDQQLQTEARAAWEQMRWGTAFAGGIAGLVVGLLTGVTLLVLLSRRRDELH
ncbi:MAG: hypothetical protein H6636_02630 [Anaerolineales bacterium]|nr:hypothetical protein [Anaerolineales bacterium]